MLGRYYLSCWLPKGNQVPGPQRSLPVGTGPAHSHRALRRRWSIRQGSENWELSKESDEAVATEGKARGSRERRLEALPPPGRQYTWVLPGVYGSGQDANLSASTLRQGDPTVNEPVCRAESTPRQ